METKKEFSILLHIIEGIGLNDANGEVSLTVTLNGTKFYVNGNKTENSTIFNSNCIWECKFDDLKRMKTDNRPIKIECFCKTIKKNKETSRAIGFILLPIRTLPTIKTVKNCEIKLHWYKLCGLGKEWRQSKPEIYLSAIITTKELINSGQLEEFLDPKPVDSLDSTINQPLETALMLKPECGIYVNLLADERLLQVGNGSNDCDIFIMTLTLKNARHLEALIGSGGITSPVFRFHFNLLGMPSDCLLVPNSYGVYNIQEKISINFKSSLNSLRDYFQRVFFIPMNLYHNESLIGSHKFMCADLLPSNLDVFKDENVWKVNDCFFFDTVLDVVESIPRSLVEFAFCLSYIQNFPKNEPASPLLTNEGAGGDMVHKDYHFELHPTEKIDYRAKHELKVQSARHERVKEISPRAPKLDRSVSYKLQAKEPDDDLAYKIVAELEDWKRQQMKEFLIELKQKEDIHLAQLSLQWEQEKEDLAKKLKQKLDECNKITEKLEAGQRAVNEKTIKQLEKEREFEKNQHELDKKLTIRFMEVEEKARKIKNDMDYELKVQKLHYKELQIEKDRISEENVKLKEKILQMEQELEHMKKNYLPKEQLDGLFQDLKHQMERYMEMEKSCKFYKQQWANLVKEVHTSKLESLKAQEMKLKLNGLCRIDYKKDLQNLIFEEQSELIADREELQNIQKVLFETNDSESNSES